MSEHVNEVRGKFWLIKGNFHKHQNKCIEKWKEKIKHRKKKKEREKKKHIEEGKKNRRLIFLLPVGDKEKVWNPLISF